MSAPFAVTRLLAHLPNNALEWHSVVSASPQPPSGPARRQSMRAFEYRHVVGFEETNLVGNVYYANHIRWQGRCRELFLREHAPDVLRQLQSGLALVTVHCSCDYLAEINAFDAIILRMRLESMVQNRISMDFEYWRDGDEGQQLIARGKHTVACMRREGTRTVPAPIPESLREALLQYSAP